MEKLNIARSEPEVLKMPPPQVKSFSGKVSVDLVNNLVIIRDERGGCVKIPAEEISDLQMFVDSARDEF